MALPPQIQQMAEQIGQQQGLPEGLLPSLVSEESGGNSHAVSPVGAEGLTQLMPGTAAGLGVTNSFDPLQNLTAGARYLKQQFIKFGSWDLALAAYNAGPGAVAKNGNKVPSYSQKYVDNIMAGVTGTSQGSVQQLTPPPGAPQLDQVQQDLAASPPPPASMLQAGAPQLQAPEQSPMVQMAQDESQQAIPDPSAAGAFPGVNPPLPNVVPASGGGYVYPVAGAKIMRVDQGQDMQGTPGEHVGALGNARVDAVKADPGGFGQVVYYTLLDGPMKGQQIYVGHALPNVKPGDVVRAGGTIATLQQKPGGNATTPGWTEIGFAKGGAPIGNGKAFAQLLKTIKR